MTGVAEASLVLGLISSVIAIVDRAKQVYDAAANAEGLPEAFREVAERLPIVRTILVSAERHIHDGEIDENSRKAMKPVIERCGKRAEKLDKLFKKVIPPDDASRPERYLKAVRTLGKGGKVEILMKGMLEDIQLLASDYGLQAFTKDQIQQIAKALKEVSDIKTSVPDSEFRDSTITTNMLGDVHGTQNINNVEGDQYLATGSAKMYNATTMSFETKDLNFQAQTQNFISSSAFRKLMYTGIVAPDEFQEECEETILDLLAFRGMDERYEDIAEAHAQTFRWIYESPEPGFTDWLRSGQEIYWISGKAGCGKSTLMKYLILSQYRQLISVVLPRQFTMFSKGRDRIHRNGGWQWTLSELKAAFRAIVNQKALSLRLCLLIDGLDEFSGEHKDIIAVLDELARPSSDSVQDLTVGDIKKYVTDKFDKDVHLKELAANDRVTSDQIMEEILEKAEGVFLWVTLVVNSLIEGLEGGDDMKDLQRRLSELPAGLEPLYQRIVENIKPRYHEQAAQLFRIVHIAVSPLTPLALSFVDEDPKAALSAQQEVYCDKKIERRHVLVSRRLKSRCAGLIEISGDKVFYAVRRYYRVQFLHLTVKEFLASDKMQNWLATRRSTNTPNLHVRILTCALRQLQVTGCTQLRHHHTQTAESGPFLKGNDLLAYFASDGIINLILFHAIQAENILCKSQLLYFKALDKLMQDAHATPPSSITEGRESEAKQRSPHWTTFRYDWTEPDQWHSDFVAYLIAIRMTRSVIEAIHVGYEPSSKPGMPLLHYAISHIAPDYAIRDQERDNIDPEIVEGLLKKGCDPNQTLNLSRGVNMRATRGGTIWEDALLHAQQRFCLASQNTQGAEAYYPQQWVQTTEMDDLRLRWVKTFRLFAEYGADLQATVYAAQDSEPVVFKMSALSIFNDAFTTFEHPLVESTRELLISKGATVVKQRSFIAAAIEIRDKSHGNPEDRFVEDNLLTNT
ncbi:uncharacterized protein PAC_06079 [Phialocephala subalpina]|uniref:Uncharacterized protein n=1 Tax=Phialocephala subalpina TaxID=576137 RepID=A0A1L7WTT7_9HELO|nr:uncharacterized protein PAC_06079 [Phialocephala subalpina]